MNNAKKFKETFGMYATELWAMPEGEFLKWLNAPFTEPQINPCDNCQEFDCYGCKWKGE